MKTKEQNKQEVINYLTKCSKHTFVKGIEEWRRVGVSKGELTKEFVKIFVTDDGFSIYEFGKTRKITMLDIDKMVESYKSNSKNQTKMSIFYNPFSGKNQLLAIKNTRYTESQIQNLLTPKKDVEESTKLNENKGFLSRLFKF